MSETHGYTNFPDRSNVPYRADQNMKDYHAIHGIGYEPPKRKGVMALPMLHFLWGHTWNQMALNFVHALTPSCIRVVRGSETTDSWPGRVTVYVTQSDIIMSIVQEAHVGLDGNYDHSHDLRCKATQMGINLRSIP